MPGAPVNVSIGPPTEAWSEVSAYDGANNLEYVGLARSLQREYSLTVVAVSKAVDAAFTITAHGLQVGNAFTVAGATGDWAALNGVQIVKAVSDANTITIETDSSGYAGDFDGTVTSRAPRTNQGIWAIRKLFYDAGNKNTRQAWASGNVSCDKAWDSRTTYSYQ
jgi:hypothetical protein